MTLNVNNVFKSNVDDAQDEYWKSQADQGTRGKYISKAGSSVVFGTIFGAGSGAHDMGNYAETDVNQGTYYVLPAGSILKFSVYNNSTNDPCQCAIYRYAPGSEFIGSSIQVNLNGTNIWEDLATASTTINIEAGSYILCFNTDSLNSSTLGRVSGASLNIENRSATMNDTYPITSTAWTGGNGDFTADIMYDITVTYSGTVPIVTDNELYFNLESNSLYNFQFNVGANATSSIPDLNITCIGPGSSSGKIWMTDSPINLGSYFTLALTSGISWNTIYGYIKTENIEGRLEIKYTPNTNSTDVVTVHQGSWGTLTKQ